MIAALWEPVLAGALVVVGLGMVVLVVGAFLIWRYGRRKWRALHAHGAVIAVLAGWDALSGGFFRPKVPMTSADATRWRAGRVRKEMWRAVDQAERAVRAADGVGAPTADMVGLCRRLREVAIGLDRVLRVDPSGSVPAAIASQTVEVARAARDLQGAAMASAGDATVQQVADLTRDAGQEIQLLDAGLASARVALSRNRR